MGIRKFIRKYKDYESKELVRRAEKKKKLRAYRALKDKNIITKKPRRKFNMTAYANVIGDPYSIKYPKAKKVLKKVKKSRHRKLRRKVVIIYK